MKIIVSFITTKFSRLRKFWEQNKNKESKDKFCGTDRENKIDLGGKIIMLDWNKKKIIKEKSIKTPAGLDIRKGIVYAAESGSGISFFNLNLKRKGRISNQYLNDIHSVNLIDKNYIIIASTGVDGIIIIDIRGNLCWSWFATEQGYNKDPKGRSRIFNKDMDHRKKQYPTLRQTTHLNSAIYVGKTKYFDSTIYCSLFHQGQIIAIDRCTLKSKKVLSGLKHQHSLYLINKKIVLSDTENGSIIISNKNLDSIKRFKIGGVGWIQDTAILRNGNLLISDPDNNRIIEFDLKRKEVKGEMVFNKEWRIYQAKEVI